MSTDPAPTPHAAAVLEVHGFELDRERVLLAHPFHLDAGESVDLVWGEALESEATSVSERDRVRLVVHAPPRVLDGGAVHLYLGSVPIASTHPEGPDELKLHREGPGTAATRAARPFLDCAGAAPLVVAVGSRGDEPPRRVAAVVLRVLPSKVSSEEFERLLADLEEVSTEVLREEYARTFTGESRPRDAGRLTPVEELERLRGTVDLFGAQLARIAHRPAQRLSLSPRRVGVSPGDAITPETVASLVEDTSFLARTQLGVLPRERIDMTAERDVLLPEHAALSGFLALLAEGVRSALDRVQREISAREARRRVFAEGSTGIWATREEPRIRALRETEGRARGLLARCREIRRRSDLLPPDVPPLLRPPELTKRFAHVGGYSVLYRAMIEHFERRDVALDPGFYTAMPSLPVLWELWVVLKVLRFLGRRLRHAGPPGEAGTATLFRRTVGARDRLLLDLKGPRHLELASADGRRVLFRYQPRYSTIAARRGQFGRLQRRGAPYEPDMSIEIYPVGSEEGSIPEHIVILDAKYSSRSHAKVLESISRYRNIGEFRTGRRLARHVWAITSAPKGPPAAGPAAERLDEHATVDNEAFFEPGFSAQADVCGVLGVRPEKERAREPLDLLLTRTFAVLGVA
jgi:hypothetical protein